MNTTLPLLSDAELNQFGSRSIAEDDRGFGALRTASGHLPLESLDVHGRIDGLLARTVVRQTFVNAFDKPLEAAYIFPLPDRAAVTRFRMSVAGREIEGILEERGQAREHYAEAIARGERAAIAEEDRPGVFNLHVGNLMPGERATVELTLCGVLPYADGEVTYRFPLVVAPRYIPGRPLPGPSVGEGTAVDTDAVPDASRISPPVLLPGFPSPVRLSLAIELHGGAAEPSAVRSSLHAVQEQSSGEGRRIRIQPGERLDRDFILRFRLGGAGVTSALTLHPDADADADADAGRGGTFALTVVPPSAPSDAPGRPRDVVFLLDRSGSMEGWKMVAARRTVAALIETLNDADRFAILVFDSTVERPTTLPNGLAPADHRARFRASEYLAAIGARGGTEIAEPLDRGVTLLSSDSANDRDRILVLITDGQVGNEDQVLKLLGTRVKSIRIFAIGIDRAVNESFLRRLADSSGGACELVESEERLDEVMSAIRRRIGPPILEGLGLEPDGLAIEPGELVPRRLPDLFPGSPLLILGRYRGRPSGSITLRGTNAARVPSVQSVAAQVRENPAIAAAWARGQIRQLEDRYAIGTGNRSALEKAIVQLSLRFQVLCRFTAYVAVDRSQAANPGGQVHRITQPVEMPQGWAGGPVNALSTVPSSALRVRSGLGMAFAPSRGIAAGALPPPVEFFAYALDPAPPTVTRVQRPHPEGPMPPMDAAALVAALADVIQQVHDRGHVQGEINADSIVLDDGNRPSIRSQPVTMLPGRARPADLASGATAFTPPAWLQPNGDVTDRRGDIYSLGVVLYYVLTGVLPFTSRPGSPELVREILAGTPVPPRQLDPAIPAALEAICLKAMTLEPAARYATAAELARALRGVMKRPRKAFWK